MKPPEREPQYDDVSATPIEPGGKPVSLLWKGFTITLGGLLILIGIIGLFLPGLQGILTILAGLAMLSPHSRRARWILKTLKEKLKWIKGRKK